MRTRLGELKAGGAKAIFYLGDGANNGCQDEFAGGLDPATRASVKLNDQGVLTILDIFRAEAQIPVYFVLGNHDLLGAGSTGKKDFRRRFCSGPGAANPALSKAEVIALADRFNRANEPFAADWRYISNYRQGETEAACGPDTDWHHRTWGCYLAATVDYRGSGPRTQFLLIDTNDWASVSRSGVGNFDFEGIRGAMSFGIRDGKALSQTAWFEAQTVEKVPLRVALSHYDVPSLRKLTPIGPVSNYSQQFMNLFSSAGPTRTARQASAFVMSGHTHTRDPQVRTVPFKIGCRRSGCEPRQRLSIAELNIGSTTDSTNYASIAHLSFDGSSGSVTFETRGAVTTCDSVFADIARHRFPHALRGFDTGWKAIGIDRANRHNYSRFDFEDVSVVWSNLDSYAGADPRHSDCVALYAAATEAGRKLD